MNAKKRSIGFTYAWNGIIEAWKSERNFRSHILSAFIVILAGIFFQLSVIEWIIIVFCIGFVIVTELLNTAIEKLLDYLKPDIHPKAKIIKDLSAGAVLISALCSAIVGLLIFLPKLYKLFL
ncbi:diacylglycerol kinase family protein [Ornithinibacillus halophilus]|uniref:Undecaprenol kinase n=1 Tax=Ornithinibacillus halophilus TaxID=930117 RepID=A0A1M5DN29_9BACI|nr:diacylglycerol kinase family protein [Ornithinibacillus halophilus]SHF68284.1 undecaprenol kinase [Ornithinibacillus halophilus]